MRFDADYQFDEFFEYLYQWLFGISFDVETPGEE